LRKCDVIDRATPKQKGYKIAQSRCVPKSGEEMSRSIAHRGSKQSWYKTALLEASRKNMLTPESVEPRVTRTQRKVDAKAFLRGDMIEHSAGISQRVNQIGGFRRPLAQYCLSHVHYVPLQLFRD
jgi:hypothetical protein